MTGGDHPDHTEPLDDEAPQVEPPVEDRVALVWNGLHELSARLDGTEDAVAGALDTLSTAVADLKTQLTGLLVKEREKDVTPRRWADRATAKDWAALVDWVDRLIRDYSLLGDYTVPACWPAHPGVVEELAGLWRSWTRALINDQLAKKTGGNDLTAWHDRWLWPTLRRMKAGHYRTTNCRDRHQPERGAAAITGRAFVPNSR
jgi:hypothetical protein